MQLQLSTLVVEFDSVVTDLDVVLHGQSAVHESVADCDFSLVLLPDASVTCSPTISDKGRLEVIGTSVYTL